MKTKNFLMLVILGLCLCGCTTIEDNPAGTPDIPGDVDGAVPGGIQGGLTFEDDAHAIKSMTSCYELILPRVNEDPYRYWILNGCLPTMDAQASGWNKLYMTQEMNSWNPMSDELWTLSYTCIYRCNDFLAGLETAEDVSEEVKSYLKGEAMALRGFMYFGLANTFGRVPLLTTGETPENTPDRPRAESFREMWDFVIADFEKAVQLLDWNPFQEQTGRCTKGMALAFLGDAYMWKAYTVPETANECYQKAYDAFQQIINSDIYELNPSFSTLYDAEDAWPKECIWQILLNTGDEYGLWDNPNHAGSFDFSVYFGPTSNGAWGAYHMSWELYDSFENYLDGDYAGSFDKRRDASLVTGTVPYEYWKDHPTWQQNVVPTKLWLETNKKYLRGYFNKGTEKNPDYQFDQDIYDKFDMSVEGDNGLYDPKHPIGFNPFNQEFVGWNGYHWASADPAPTVWSTKHWRNDRGYGWSTGMLWQPDHVYYKRYANVLLDLAECCFRLGKDAEGWALVNQIRERAFGNLEVGKDLSKYCNNHQKIADAYGDQGHGDAVDLDGYPLPFNTEVVKVPDAQDYYTKVKAEKGYTSEVWKVAVNQERRKEFSAEPYLRSDLQKSGFLEEHVNTAYPKNSLPENGPTVIREWRTARNFDFNKDKMFMPIPENELMKNPSCDQNSGY